MTQQTPFVEPKPEKEREKRRKSVNRAELARLFESLPPHAYEAEMSVLGAMMVRPDLIGDVVQILKDGADFFSTANGIIYDAIVELYDERSGLDLVQFNQLLVDRDLLDAIGGQTYLVELTESVPATGHATHYAKLVRDKSVIRQLINEAGEIIHEAYTNPGESQAILDGAEQRIFRIAERYESGEFDSLDSLLDQARERLYSDEVVPLGHMTRFDDLDRMTGGLQRGELTIIAARPSMGKTALALNMAEQVSEAGMTLAFFSLEMSKEQLVQRLVGARAGVDVQKLRRNMLNKAEREAARDACVDLRQRTSILVDDMPALNLLQLRAKARRLAAQHDVGAIFIDYLQLLTMRGRVESRQIEVSAISRGLKAIARELNVPVVCMSQLNRGPEQREGHKPRLSDLRESGSIEQDADVVLLLHREDYYHKDDEAWEPTHVAELIIAKQRNGPTGMIKLSWDPASTRFRNHSYATAVGTY